MLGGSNRYEGRRNWNSSTSQGDTKISQIAMNALIYYHIETYLNTPKLRLVKRMEACLFFNRFYFSKKILELSIIYLKSMIFANYFLGSCDFNYAYLGYDSSTFWCNSTSLSRDIKGIGAWARATSLLTPCDAQERENWFMIPIYSFQDTAEPQLTVRTLQFFGGSQIQ